MQKKKPPSQVSRQGTGSVAVAEDPNPARASDDWKQDPEWVSLKVKVYANLYFDI